ncbi:MAG: hypothetical protein HOD17_03585 [Desulfobacteraceae bacterium]|jgi:hypothetical protein|nr:hypothetical protein [Desulfobacteraceae bacterium]
MSHHDHNHDTQSTMSFEEKLVKLLDHWVKHNIDHAGTYKEWAEKAGDKGLDKVVLLLNEASELTIEINEKFKEAVGSIKI